MPCPSHVYKIGGQTHAERPATASEWFRPFPQMSAYKRRLPPIPTTYLPGQRDTHDQQKPIQSHQTQPLFDLSSVLQTPANQTRWNSPLWQIQHKPLHPRILLICKICHSKPTGPCIVLTTIAGRNRIADDIWAILRRQKLWCMTQPADNGDLRGTIWSRVRKGTRDWEGAR